MGQQCHVIETSIGIARKEKETCSSRPNDNQGW